MNPQVLEHILRGETRVSSPEALASLLAKAPGHPELLRIHAGALEQGGRIEAARRHYLQAAAGFLAAGRTLAAWSAAMRAWRLRRPAAAEVFAVHEAIERSRPRERPADRFLQALGRAERMAVFSRCLHSAVPAGAVFQRPGTPPQHLHLVVSGALRESRYETIEERPRRGRPPIRLLGEGDAFGEVYPFHGRRSGRVLVEGVEPAEVLSIGRRRLMRACLRHPGVEGALVRLLGVRSEAAGAGAAEGIRKGDRYRIPVSMSVVIDAASNGGEPLRLAGLSFDLSVSGVCFIPETDGLPPAPTGKPGDDPWIGRRVRAALHGQGMTLEIDGRIARRRTLLFEGRRTPALAIRFDGLPPRLRGLLFAFAENLAAGSSGSR